MPDPDRRPALSRRAFLAAGAAATGWPHVAHADPLPPELARAVAGIEPYFTPAAEFQDVSRGTPIPHTLPEDQRRAVGLTRDTWRLEVVSDPDHPARLGKPFTKADGTALDFAGLLKLGETHAVRFAKVMTCLNIGCPLGMGVWEGVPLRAVVWLTKPTANLRRVWYHGYHNDDPKQQFRSSLPVGRVLEDPDGLPPVILCYKLNGEWLSPERGGPVRVVVPEAYGFKSVKWLTRVALTNLYHANDTYASGNNDIDSPLKTFAATLSVPAGKAGEPIPVTGYAQVGVSGLAKVQVWVAPAGEKWPADDPYFTAAPWTDAHVLGPPPQWGAANPVGAIGFDAAGRPKAWPMRLTKAALGGAAPRTAGRRVHAAVSDRRRERPGPADAAAVPQVRPGRDRGGEAHGDRLTADLFARPVSTTPLDLHRVPQL
ncbi:MAG: molybdopterin-dependent oxidoreductase [Gemmataceae bacterium]